MTDKSAFTDSEWHALTDAPLLVTAAIFAVGEHGPISLVKEASASARSISKPGERGVANELIGQIVAEANTKETRAEMKEHRGPTPQAAVESALHDLEPAAAALKKLPPEEAAQVAAWFVAIAEAVAQSAKAVNSDEQAAIAKLAELFGVRGMSYTVDFVNVSNVGLESSPVADALAGLRANEARYFKNKYDHVFTVEPATKAKKAIDLVSRILEEERDIVVASPPLEATTFQVENIRWTYVFYESGLSINVLYPLDEPAKRAVGFKLSEGMEIPEELGTFKFARQKSKLAGTIRGSYFKIKGEY